MEIVRHSELLSFLHGLNPNGAVSEGGIEDIIVDYNGQYMYSARITYDSYHCRWKCAPIQHEHGNPDAGTGWRIVPYNDHRTVRTNRSSNEVSWTSMPMPQVHWNGANDNAQSVSRADRVSPTAHLTMREAELYYAEERRERTREFEEARRREFEEARRREFEESRQRIMNGYEGELDTPVTRDRMASELRASLQSVAAYGMHTHTSDSITCSLNEETNVPNSTEEE